jgi:arylformamidase
LASDGPVIGSPAIPLDDAIEREYNLRLRHPERGAVYDRCAAASEVLRGQVAGFTGLRYGASPNSVIDFFPAQVSGPAPLFLFIHGGYWRALDRRIFSFVARPWLARGVHVALPGYDLAPAASVGAIAAQVETALDWLLQRAGELGVDSGRVVVSGHSAGAHLGALGLTSRPGWSARAFVGISGVYDLQPLLATSVNRDVHLSAVEAQALSPQGRPADPAVRYLCAVGGAETDGFRRQSRDYAAMLRAQGCDVQLLEVSNRTHFDILDDLADAGQPLFRSAYALLQDT